jgi:hypothetical protein
MKFKHVETTYICQFSKPENKAVLESYRDRKDKSGKELANYYLDIIRILETTPAWGVSGVNKMINELTDKVRATLKKEKRGKTSAYAHANKLLRDVDYFSNNEATAYYNGRYKLAPLLNVEELHILETI